MPYDAIEKESSSMGRLLTRYLQFAKLPVWQTMEQDQIIGKNIKLKEEL